MIEAMEEEIHGKMVHVRWEPVERPHTKVLKGRWVPGAKLNNDNSISEIKMRYVGCGYSQEKGKDFDSVFAGCELSMPHSVH